VNDSLSIYQPVRIEGRVIYAKRETLNHLDDVEAVIFDCDGVLIDTRKSYNLTIIQTARFILSQLIGFPFPQRVITPSIIDRLRRSGGFNNDWDSTYVILLYLFSCLPKRFLERCRQSPREFSERDGDVRQWPARLEHLGHQLRGALEKSDLSEVAERMHRGLSRFVERADSSGISSLEAVLFTERQPTWKVEARRWFKLLLGYPESGAEGLLAITFDEIFYGPDLFQKAHRCRPQFYTGAGAIENEIPIITQATLEQLTDLVGRRNLGIASGRGTLAIKKTLGRLLSYFNPKARVLLEDEELKARDDLEILRVDRAKPAPYSLLKSARAMKKFTRALYVGDSAEDLIMARRAQAVDARYLFAGVTDHALDPASKRKMFAEAMVDLIVPSVNQLPALLRARKAPRD
jgi:phosphoglycolate phosphatase-like HAD superfamily hydrolase